MQCRIDQQFISSKINFRQILDSRLLELLNFIPESSVKRVELIDFLLVMLVWDHLQRLSSFGQCLVPCVNGCVFESHTLVDLGFALSLDLDLSSTSGNLFDQPL